MRCLVHRTLAGTEVASRLVDSPVERYRASFAFIYMVCADSQEHYKHVRKATAEEANMRRCVYVRVGLCVGCRMCCVIDQSVKAPSYE